MKYKRITAAMLAAGIMIMQTMGTVYASEETENLQPPQVTEAVEPETAAPEPEPQPETQAPQPETQAPQPETQAPQPETSAPQPETSAPQPETSAPQPETSAPQAEANHSTKIPENPTETKLDQEIVDAGEEYSDPETDPDGDGQDGEVPGEETYDSYEGTVYQGRMPRDFRFTKVDKKPAVTTKGSDGLIREDADGASAAVGKIASGGTVYLLAQKGCWYFVESGDVRGFMKDEDLLVRDEEEMQDTEKSMEEDPVEAVSLCRPSENESYTYTFTTVHEVLAQKQEALLIGHRNIYEFTDDTSRTVGKGNSGCLVYILGIASDGWYFVESADVRGFIRFEDLVTGRSVEKIIEDEGEGGMTEATETISPSENRSLYFTLLSVKESSTPSSGIFLPGSGNLYYSQDQMELIWAIVAQEDNGSYEGALAVITSAVNRSESPVWGYLGGDALAQLTAPGQYCYSLDDYWRPRLGGNVPDYVKQAVEDCLIRGIRNHPYTSFRSTKGKTTGYDAVQIGGNWFFGN